MVPLSDKELMIDLIERLKLPVALVVRNYLGCINHTLLSILALKERGLIVDTLILNGAFPSDTEQVIINYTEKETKIIRLPDIHSITRENITAIAKQLTNL